MKAVLSSSLMSIVDTLEGAPCGSLKSVHTCEVKIHRPPCIPLSQDLPASLNPMPSMKSSQVISGWKLQFWVAFLRMTQQLGGRESRCKKGIVKLGRTDDCWNVVLHRHAMTSFSLKALLQPLDVLEVKFLGLVWKK